MAISTIGANAIGGLGYGFKNRIINGGMVIDQRNAGAAVSISVADGFGVDRWRYGWITSGVYTAQQVADAPAGFTYSSKIAITTTTTANDYAFVYQRIEANNVFDLGWGTSSGQTVTLSFWVKANNAGTYCASVLFAGSTNTYYYTSPYTIATANTWQQVTITVAAPPTAAGAFTAAANATYMTVYPVTIGSSGASGTATANTWSSNAAGFKTSGSINLASTASATFQFTGVQLEKGNVATSFDWRPYGTELALCQRYFISYGGDAAYERMGTAIGQGSTTAIALFTLPVQMRAAPTFGYSAVGNFCTYNGSGTFTMTSFAGDQPCSKTPTVQVVAASGMSAGAAYHFLANNSTSARATWSAEL